MNHVIIEFQIQICHLICEKERYLIEFEIHLM